ncbi:MAG: DUF1801 domain-containing protein [Bacteroidota bacterium]
MGTLANSETNKSVTEFLEAVPNQQRKADSLAILEVMKAITGEAPKIWGKSIVGFGKYSYQRKNGDEFEWFNVGFSPAKAHLSVYLMFDIAEEPLMAQLGKHTHGRGCLYIKRLEDVDMDVLKQLIAKSDRWSREGH